MAIYSSKELVLVFFALALLAITVEAQNSSALVPAIFSFGDSLMDVGNNNYITTIFRANYPPYGRDFIDHKATGRFCNGKLFSDITADTLGFTNYPAAYLSPQATGKNLLIGANFASAASGYDDITSIRNLVIPLSQQLEYYKEYQAKLAKVAGSDKAATIVKDALYLVSSGSNDYVFSYYLNPLLNILYTPDHYSSYLIGIFSSFIKDLYGLGARRIGVFSLPPIGCFPGAMTLFGIPESGCVDRINTDAQGFNQKLNLTSSDLQRQLPGLKIVVFNIFKAIYDVVKTPSKYGFVEAKKGCCGTGLVETTVVLCNPISPETCSNASQYVFWDIAHPSQATNQVLVDSLMLQRIDLIG